MAVRTLDQILSELGSTYDPQIAAVRQRQAAIPGQIASEEQGLQAKQTQAFDQILGGARQRGLGFSGIPLGEQARYTATEFLPSIARLRTQGRQEALSLEDAILGINERRNTMAQQLRQGDVDRDFQERQFAESQRQFNEQLAAQHRSAASSNAGLAALLAANKPSAGTQAAAPAAAVGSYGLKNGSDGSGGFWFTDNIGNPVSAAEYAALNNMSLIPLLQKMAAAGDTYARDALNQVRGPGFTTAQQQQFSGLFSSKVSSPSKPTKSSGKGGPTWL